MCGAAAQPGRLVLDPFPAETALRINFPIPGFRPVANSTCGYKPPITCCSGETRGLAMNLMALVSHIMPAGLDLEGVVANEVWWREDEAFDRDA